MKIKLEIKPDTPTKNNIIYPKDVLLKAFEDKKDSGILVTYETKIFENLKSTAVPFSNIIGIVNNFTIDKFNIIMADFNEIPTPLFMQLKKQLKSNKLSYTLNGVGEVENNIVKDNFKIVSCAAFRKEKIPDTFLEFTLQRIEELKTLQTLNSEGSRYFIIHQLEYLVSSFNNSKKEKINNESNMI